MDPLYRFCLRALPGRFRSKHAREIELTFRETTRTHRGVRKLVTVVRAVVDVVEARWMLRGRFRSRRRNERSTMMDQVVLDMKFALRSLKKRSGITLLALVTLGVGIGAVTAVYSVVRGVLFRPLPYAASDRIAILWHDLGNGAQSLPALNPLDFFDYRDRAELFESWTLATGRERIFGEKDEPELVDVGVVAANFFEFFGVDPLFGRGFTLREDAPGGAHAAVLSHRLWSRRFGGDPTVVGKTIRLGGEDHEVVGVLPGSFRLLLPAEAFRLRDAEIWVPAQIDVNELPPRNYTGWTGFGKLRAGVSFDEAQQEMDRLEAQLKEEHLVHQAANLQVRAVPLHGDVVKRARPTLYVLLAAVAFVLLIACGNTSQLLLARWRGGERELSVRAAMGAGPWRLARLVVIESMWLSLGGGSLGIVLAALGVVVLPRVATESVPRLHDVVMDGSVLAFALAASVATAIVFSVVPVIALSRANLATVLAESGRSSGSKRQVNVRNTLLVAEVALSVVLLVATGLTIRSFAALLEADPGFEPRGVLTLRVSLPSPQFDEEEARRVFHELLEQRLLGLPGVRNVATINQLPLTGSGSLQPYAYDEETATNWESVTADERFVSPRFLETIGATLLAGREFTKQDAPFGRKYAVIDETLAARAFPGQNPLGRLIRVEPLGHEEPFTEVIGVVAHVKLHDLTRAFLPQFYFPANHGSGFSLVVRTHAAPQTLAAPLRDTIRSLAPGAAVEDVTTMEELVAGARSQARLSLVLMLGFGALAILLAAVGLFGVVSYTVGLRRIEFGIRMALGASPSGIRKGVLVQGARLVFAATLLGLLVAALIGPMISGLLFGVHPVDLVTYVGVAGTLAVMALLACWLPAVRATRIDPALVLKAE